MKSCRILQRFNVPTGDILIVEGDPGKKLECLSLGDYGKDKNIKADFLGYCNEINGVPNGQIEPLENKWVITISTQYGCSMGCNFCDVPRAGPGVNATLSDLVGQVKTCIDLHPEVEKTERLNIHFARMGEPTWNNNVLDAAEHFKFFFDRFRFPMIHPVVSSMMPKKNRDLQWFLNYWLKIKTKNYKGEAGLQLSINSTNEMARNEMFNGNAHTLIDCAKIANEAIVASGGSIVGRKIALNFALTSKYEVDARALRDAGFDPKNFMIKITPMHETAEVQKNKLSTSNGYSAYVPYKEVEKDLKEAGYDVLVFVPSIDEDNSRITCGNAILSGTKILTGCREII